MVIAALNQLLQMTTSKTIDLGVFNLKQGIILAINNFRKEQPKNAKQKFTKSL